MTPATFNDFFTTNAQDALQVLQLNRALRLGHLSAKVLTETPFNFFPRALDQARAKGKAVFHDLVPFSEGHVIQNAASVDWHLIPTAGYVHPATWAVLASILHLELPQVIEWSMGRLKWADGKLEQRQYFDMEFSTPEEILACLEECKTDSFFTEHSLEPADFVWNALPAPPAERFDFVTTVTGDFALSLYFKLTSDLIRKANYMTSGYRISPRAYLEFCVLNYNWILVVQRREWNSLWQLRSYAELIDLNVERSTRSLPTVSLADFKRMLAEQDRPLDAEDMDYDPNYPEIEADPRGLRIVSPQLLVEQRQDRLLFIGLPDFQEVSALQLPNAEFQILSLSGSILYLRSSQVHALLAVDIESHVFVVPDSPLEVIYQFDEIQEQSYLTKYPPGTAIQLEEVSDYPVIHVFDAGMRYFWCMDKESSGGVFDLETGLLIAETPLDDIPFQKSGLWFLSVEGELEQFEVTEEEEDDVDEFELDEEDDNLSQEKWKALGKVLQPQCFGLCGSDWLFVHKNAVYFGEKMVLAVYFPICYATFDPEHCLLYLANADVQVVLDMQDAQAPRLHARARGDMHSAD